MRTNCIFISLLIFSFYYSQIGTNNFEFKPNVEIVNYDEFYIDGGQKPAEKLKEFLNELANYLQSNDKSNLVIENHTDYRGIEIRNIDYSKWLAENAKEYLIKQGVKEERISTFGKGENFPIEVTEEINKEYNFLPIGQILNEEFIVSLKTKFEREKANEFNRRTVFKIIEN